MRLSIIIPTLNEEAALPETLRSIAQAAPCAEVLVVDGGSTDRTREVAEGFRALDVRWLGAPRGRGNQMNAGAAAATGDVLLFLHADTTLPAGAQEMVRRVMEEPRILGGNFRIRFVPRAPLADLFTWCYNVRSHLHIFYGDSAIFIRREVFQELGGYRAELLMEDIDLVLRLRRAGRLAYLRDAPVCSSARRFQSVRAGIKSLAVWTLLHVLMLCRVSQERLDRLYPMVR